MKKTLLTCLVAAVAATIAGTSFAGEIREWTNTAGKTIKAEPVSASADEVVVKMEDGREFTIELNTLSKEDNEFVQKWWSEMKAIAEAPKPAVEPLMTKPGKLIYANALTAIEGDWKANIGEWAGTGEFLTGKELAADDHGAVMKLAMPIKDAIIEYDVMIGESNGTTFSIDDDKDHVCRVSLSSTGFQARKDDNDHEGPDEAKPFNQVSMEIEKDEWYTVHIEMLGEEMLASVDEEISLGSDPLINKEKAKWGFTVAGDTVKFRNIRVWEALPNEDWEKTGSRLKRKLDIDD